MIYVENNITVLNDFYHEINYVSSHGCDISFALTNQEFINLFESIPLNEQTNLLRVLWEAHAKINIPEVFQCFLRKRNLVCLKQLVEYQGGFLWHSFERNLIVYHCRNKEKILENAAICINFLLFN